MKMIAKMALKVAISGAVLLGANFAHAQDCASLQSQKNLILASSGYCFNDAALQQQYGKDCHTKRPKFTDSAVQAKFTSIESQLKANNCPKID